MFGQKLHALGVAGEILEGGTILNLSRNFHHHTVSDEGTFEKVRNCRR
jgi:hypothetical protein